MAGRARFPDCESCEAPCCRRQFMQDDDRWFTLKDIRAIYREADRRSGRTVGATRSGAPTTSTPLQIDVRVVGWAQHDDGRQPMIECTAFDTEHLRCGAYDRRPEHCRTYDCRDDEPDDWRARPHCDVERHRREAATSRRRARSRWPRGGR